MSYQVAIATPQSRYKDSFASSSNVGVTLRSNGEEKVKIIDRNGNVFEAEIPTPTVAPTLALATTGASDMTASQWVGYAYVYAADKVYPFVENANAINGSLAPRSNPSPNNVIQIGATPHPVNVSVTYSTRTDITEIWLFRTQYFATSLEAQTAANAGQVFFIAAISNNVAGGTTTYADSAANTGVDQPDLDCYPAPQFQFCIYSDPYWWGFGNFPFVADIAYFTNGAVQLLNATDIWFNGRNNQLVTVEGITTGGFDGQGGFYFTWSDSTHGQLTLDGTNPASFATNGASKIIIQGPATTLYRSKYRNPFAWGETIVIDNADVPQMYSLKVDGGYGTAIAVVPSVQLLKLDTEYPSRCHVLNLKLAGTDTFENTLRTISDNFSVSSHFSQFAAMTQQGVPVLWGMDYKNFAILQSNGIVQTPISNVIPKTLRQLTTLKNRQLMCHGLYDPKTEMNCIWVTTNDSLSLVNYLIFQHVPTGFWGFVDEQDVSCSALIQDTEGNYNKVLAGTQSGFLGQAFADNTFNNWLPLTGLFTGTVSAVPTFASLQTTDGNFNIVDEGVVGNWCLLTDADGGNEQWARVSAVTANQLTFDSIKPYTGTDNTQFNPPLSTGCKFYLGVIECSLTKAYDFNQPDFDKVIGQFWITQQNADDQTLIRYYRDRRAMYEQQFQVLPYQYIDKTYSDACKTDLAVPSLLSKSFCLEIINRGYSDWRLINFLMEADSNA